MPRTNYSPEEKKRLAAEFKAQPPGNGRVLFAQKHNVSQSTMYDWAQSKGLGTPGAHVGKRPTNGHAEATPATLQNIEIDTLRIENVVLKANLSLAIRRGYLNELVIGDAHVSK